MLALLGVITIAVLLAAIMLNWLSPLVALILVPTPAGSGSPPRDSSPTG
jgi:Mg2+/citrate symporter